MAGTEEWNLFDLPFQAVLCGLRTKFFLLHNSVIRAVATCEDNTMLTR